MSKAAQWMGIGLFYLVSLLWTAGPSEGAWFTYPGARWKWWEDPKIRAQLNLTSQQIKEIRDVVRAARESLIDLRVAMEKKGLLLEDEVEREDFSLSRALSLAEEFHRARCALERDRIMVLLQIRAILSADQYSDLRAILRERRPRQRGAP
jgi:Spy/CpxP family protein refolding chaperone